MLIVRFVGEGGCGDVRENDAANRVAGDIPAFRWCGHCYSDLRVDGQLADPVTCCFMDA